MKKPDAIVAFTDGRISRLDVFAPGFVIEVRDYDVADLEGKDIRTDEHGKRHLRYIAHGPTQQSPRG